MCYRSMFDLLHDMSLLFPHLIVTPTSNTLDVDLCSSFCSCFFLHVFRSWLDGCRGLLVSKMYDTAKDIVLNLVYLVEEYGFVLNGARSYYTNRR